MIGGIALQERLELKTAIDRIQRMEAIFDLLLQAWQEDPASLREDASIREKLDILVQYYESRLWLADFEKDEKGMLPKELKRGVLSEDAVYDFLREIKDNLKE